MNKKILIIDKMIRILFITFFAAICAWFVAAQYTLPSDQVSRDYWAETFDQDWFLLSENGEKLPFEVPGACDMPQGKTVILEKTLPSDISTGTWLCFRTSKQDMYIYVDDEFRGGFSTKDTRPFGIASASTYLFIELYPSDCGKTLTVNMTSASSYSGVMRSVLYGDKMGIVVRIFKDNSIILLFAVFMLLLGIGSICLTFALQHYVKKRLHLRYLGWCIVAISLWIIMQSKMRQAFFPNISVTSAFSEFILFLVPLPFAIYMDNIQNNRYQKFYLLFEAAALIHAITATALIFTSTIDQGNINLSIYILLLALIILVFITIILDIKHKYIQEYLYVSYGILGVLLAAILQILQSLNKGLLFNGSIICSGFLFMLIMACVQTVIDVIHAEKEKQQALYASEAKAKFLASMSHEIRTPINAVLGIDELIAKESTEENIREYAEDIRTAGRNLLAIINDILDFSKIESGKMSIIPMEYDLASVINDSCSIMKVKADEKGLIFQTICDEKLPSRLYGDEVRIRQIMINLLSNAIKYTPEGTVTLSVHGQQDDSGHFQLEISVKDTGIGIKEESMPLLFDSFSRVDESTTHKIEGTGLGLSIVRNLTELMNGKIQVDSQYGKGSVFTICLPQGIISDKPIGNLSNAYINRHTSNDTACDLLAPEAKILVVDDVPVNIKVFCGLLKDTLIHIDTAASGHECLRKIRSNSYDIIFLDHMMPDLDGVETLNQINKLAFDKKTPVIMLTANAILGAKEEYLQKGFDDYLSKPIQRDRLFNLVKQYLPDELLLTQENINIPPAAVSIENIDFLNTELGLSFYGGDVDFYLEIIEAVLEADYSKKIQTFYEKEDWHNYQILVHSLKSSSKSIGAEELSAKALELETAAKTHDIAFIHAHHAAFMDTYQKLLSNIRNLFLRQHDSDITDTTTGTFDILVIDDDTLNLKTARKILDEFFHVTCMESGKKALSYLETHLPDLILLDIHMPEMNGFEVLKEIKANSRTKDVPVIFLTADNDTDTELNSFKAGVMDFIRKPFIPDIMLERINRIIELDRLQQYLQDEVKKNAIKVEKLSLQAMLTLAQTIDAKDKYTKGHSSRVAKYSKKLAIKLGLSKAEQDTIYFMGLLHDIGKIGIPDNIINKPQKLTDEEFAIIKKHPEIGYDILKNIAEIPNIEAGARWHHERIDGKGYPDGLKGHEIPPLVRIISVADAYDAMTSKRSYRDILPQSYIKEELEKGKGKQFDPEVAEAMIQLIDEDTDYLMNEN